MIEEKQIRAYHLDEAPDKPLPDWVYHVLRKGEKAYYLRGEEGLIVVCLSSDPSRDGKNLWLLKENKNLKRSVPCTNCGAPVFWREVEPEEPLCKSCIEKVNKQTTEWLKHVLSE